MTGCSLWFQNGEKAMECMQKEERTREHKEGNYLEQINTV